MRIGTRKTKVRSRDNKKKQMTQLNYVVHFSGENEKWGE